MSLLNWADKKNSPNLADFISKYGAQYCMTAEEINEMRDAVNEMGEIQKTTFLGVAEPTDTPTGTGRGYWEVITPGTYTNFGGLILGTDQRGLISRDNVGAFSISKTGFDFSGFILKTKIIDNLTDGGKENVLSAEIGKNIGEELIGVQTSRYNSVADRALDWFLIRNESFKYSGKLASISALAYQDGKLKFQVVRRVSASGETSGAAGVFIPISDFTVDVLAGSQTYNIEENNILVEQGDYLGISKENPLVNNPPMFSPAVDIRDYSWTTYSSGIISVETGMELRAYDVGFGYSLTYSKKDDKIVTREINVIRNANDYNSIKNTMDAITDNSYYNRYTLKVSNGNWFELDIRGKKYVKILCESRDAVIYCDATQTAAKYTVPAGYPYGSEVGKQIATVASTLLHVLFISADTDIESGTIKMIRGKYAAHIDSPSFMIANFTDVKFVSEQSIHPVGMGVWGGQLITFDRCLFESLDNEFGVGLHNQPNQTKGTTTNFFNCKWVGCSYLKLDELGSNQRDVVNLIGAIGDSVKTVLIAAIPADGTNSYWKDENGNTTTNPLEVPHCFEINDNGSDIDWLRIVFYFWSAYPNTFTRDMKKLLKTGFNSYATAAKCDGEITKGDPVYIRNYTSPYVSILKYGGEATNKIIGIALQSGVTGDIIYYAKKGKIAGAIVDGTPFATIASAKLTFNEVTGKLTSNPTAPQSEVVSEAMGADIDGLTFVKVVQ